MSALQWEKQTCPERDALTTEWLETNGRGGYASSTLQNCHTRKYHGLFVANLQTPPGRHVLLSKFEDSLVAGGKEHFFSRHLYPEASCPPASLLAAFRLAPGPEFTYEAEGLAVTLSIRMVHGKDQVLLRYQVIRLAGKGLLRLKPLLAYRGHHALSLANPFVRPEAEEIPNGFILAPYGGMPPLAIQTSLRSVFHPAPAWYYRFVYPQEAERGYDSREDLFCPGVLDMPVRKGSVAIVSASLSFCPERLHRVWSREEKRRAEEANQDRVAAATLAEDDRDRERLGVLLRAGRQCLIRTPAGHPSLVAGYPWFGEWGRDTLISLPALTFLAGRPDQGVDILCHLAGLERQGLLPNCLSPAEGLEHAYNTVDASLWFVRAVQALVDETGDFALVRERLWPTVKRILRTFLAGTAYNIYVHDNGLLHAGTRATQLTWMDAVVHDKPVTPRWGYAVEINALWFNALAFARDLADRFGDPAVPFDDLLRRAGQSFNEAFWVEEGYLGDVFCNGFLDKSIRPNQIFAVSLPYTPLPRERWPAVVGVVRDHLWTPFGLRTLSPADPRYRGQYGGNPVRRDEAYHQGTVWPWLLDHFGEALLKSAPDREEARTFLRDHLRRFLDAHLPEAGIGSVSEVFDGDPPHRPGGCIAQAWSIAAAIRLHQLLHRASP